MNLPKFEYHDPSCLTEALDLMSSLKEKAHPIAGGTDLVVNMKKGLVNPQEVVSLSRIKEMRKFAFENGVFRMGACVKVSDIAEIECIASEFSALNEAANSLGSPLVRNVATIGGNIVSARPAADLPPSLIAYDAAIVLQSSKQRRVVSLDQFFTGPGESIIQPDELLVEIIMRKLPSNSGASYIKLGMRDAATISIVNVAVVMTLTTGERIGSVRIVLGAVGPTFVRSRSAEEILIGERGSEALFRKAGEIALKDCSTIDDHRGSRQYRCAMVRVLTERALVNAYKRSTE